MFCPFSSVVTIPVDPPHTHTPVFFFRLISVSVHVLSAAVFFAPYLGILRESPAGPHV